MNKLTRAEEVILVNQLAIMNVLSQIHNRINNEAFQLQQRIGYTDQFVKDNRDG
jgi:hypothetical protein